MQEQRNGWSRSKKVITFARSARHSSNIHLAICSVPNNLVPIYVENDPERDEMLSRDEFSAGD
jgi:hypothetical protein